MKSYMELFGGALLVQGIFEWTQIVPGYNWRTFHPVMVEVEDDRMMGAVEMTVIILGVGVRLRLTYTRTKQAEHLFAEIERVKAEFADKEQL